MPTTIPRREADMRHRIDELKEQLAAAEAATGARQALREYIAKHPALTAADVSLIATEMRAPGRFKGQIGKTLSPAVGPVGKALRAARIAKGWKGVETAEKVGVHAASISAWERGGNVTEAHHAAVKRVLGVDVAALKAKANGADPQQ